MPHLHGARRELSILNRIIDLQLAVVVLPVTSTRVLRRCCLPLSDLTSTAAILVDAWALVSAATLVDSWTRFIAAFLVNAWTLVIASHSIDSSKIDAKSIAIPMSK